ncbi:MAG: 1-acyl-sn-glycerol-3-phosphate acyltransferase [Blautia sp.]|nr:1-acyl-sn-glycerol-3-phosphate acyltransferase [Blautia sp.]MDD7729567.1 lysophospholipid acyltransferase family protein [Clostridia bacterium]MDY5664839.1 lysophospholipid acyltransferase family protein [Blautia sp.]
MIRFILCVVVVAGFLILSIPILLAEWIVGKFSPMAKEISSLRIVQTVFKAVLWVGGVKVTFIGEENVPKDTPVLYIGNHRSFFDVPLTYPRCPIRTGYVAKKEMEKVPLLSTWMKRLHCLFLDRKDIKQGLKTILEAIEKVKSGISICIFPEGTRNKNESELELLPFHEGSFKISTKAKCPIIPIAISNSANIWEAHFPKVKPTHVIVEYGKPIYVDELEKEDKKHLGSYTQNVILEMLKKNQELI